MSSKAKTPTPKPDGKPALVPKLRFPEFRDAAGWHQKPLGNVATFFKGKGLPKSALITDGKSLCIHYGELFTEYQEVIRSVRSRTNLEENVFLSVANDVLMPTSDVTPSGLAKSSCLNLENVILGGDILVIRTERQTVNGEFLARYIRHLENKVLQLVSGSTVFHLYASSMEKLVLSFPTVRAEQQKIAECLGSVDELIAAQARKLDALKTHKKGLMQQLFPREGETQPRLRFPEFQNTGEWEIRNVSQLAKVTTGAKDTQNKVEGGHYPFFVRSQTVEHIDCYSYEGEAVLTSGDGVGVGKNFHYIKGKFDFHQRVYCIYDFDEGVSGLFFYLYFSEHFGERVMRMSAKNSVDSVRMAMITEMPVTMPSLPEQQRIADCLASLDDLIAAQTQKLDALKTHKKGLMQQLFPSPEEVEA